MLALCAAGAALHAQQPPQPPPVFRSGASLVRVDVTVVNNHGDPVTSLTAADFEVEEDGVPQTVETFKLVSADGQASEGDDTSLAIRSAEHAAAEAARDEVRVFLIFWDDYHIDRMAPAIKGRAALEEFVRTAFAPTDLVALMDPLLPSDAIAFTRDRSELVQKIHKLEGRYGIYVPTRSAAEDAQLGTGQAARMRSEVTISALRGAAAQLGSLKEGRKAIVFVSEGLPALDRDGPTLIQELIQTANNNNTAIYTLDPRGLSGGVADVLWMLPASTGGQAFVNTNAPARALKQVVKDASAFYLLGYASTRAIADDGRFHSIKVHVKGQRLDVRARRGYWSPKPSETEKARAEAAVEAPKEISTALATVTAARSDRVLDVWAGVSPAAAGATVTVSWTPRTARANAVRGTVTVTDQNGGGSESVEAPLDAHRVTLAAGPGRHQLHIAARNAQDETIADETRAIDVPAFGDAMLTLGTPVVLCARNPVELRTIGEGRDLPPFAGRDFVRSDRLFVSVGVYGKSARSANVSARLVNRSGATLLPLMIARTAVEGRYAIVLPLSSVARGEYVIAITAEAGDDRAEALVPLRIVS